MRQACPNAAVYNVSCNLSEYFPETLAVVIGTAPVISDALSSQVSEDWVRTKQCVASTLTVRPLCGVIVDGDKC
jgi:hypothetical protein